MKEIIKFLVQGSQPQPYELSFEFNKGSHKGKNLPQQISWVLILLLATKHSE